MLVSVVLPCYNGAATLAVQLDSLVRQTYTGEWELVFVDNGSNDNSVEIATSYTDKLPAIRVVKADYGAGPHGGVAHSYTVGFRAAKGDPILVCEADDELGDTWMAEMVKALQTADFAAPAMDYQKLNPPGLVWGEGGQQSRISGLPNIIGPLFLPHATCCATGMTRACYERVGDPTDAMGPPWDVDYSWRVQLAGLSLVFVPDAVVHYRVRTTARARFRQASSWGRGQLNLHIRYGMSPWYRYLARVIVSLATHFRRLIIGVLLRQRPFAYYVWDIGFNWGQLQVFPARFRAEMSGIKPDKAILAGARYDASMPAPHFRQVA